jgi:hypothetical protein
MTDRAASPRPGRGRGTARPVGVYEPEPDVKAAVDGLEVAFIGDDDRRRTFSFAHLPLRELHPELAAGFAERVGPQGATRTLASAIGLWGILVRFMVFLDSLPDSPRDVRLLTPSHVDGFYRHRLAAIREQWARRERHQTILILGELPSRDQLNHEMLRISCVSQTRLRRGDGRFFNFQACAAWPDSQVQSRRRISRIGASLTSGFVGRPSPWPSSQ